MLVGDDSPDWLDSYLTLAEYVSAAIIIQAACLNDIENGRKVMPATAPEWANAAAVKHEQLVKGAAESTPTAAPSPGGDLVPLADVHADDAVAVLGETQEDKINCMM